MRGATAGHAGLSSSGNGTVVSPSAASATEETAAAAGTLLLAGTSWRAGRLQLWTPCGAGVARALLPGAAFSAQCLLLGLGWAGHQDGVQAVASEGQDWTWVLIHGQNLACGHHVGPRWRPRNGTWSLAGYGHKAGHRKWTQTSPDLAQEC